MKTLGIVGGIGPESTIAYYRQLIDGFRLRTANGTYPSLVIDSLDINRLLRFAAEPDRSELIAYATESLERLWRAGADFALLAANTPHIVFDEIAALCPIPLLSIVEAAREFANLHRLKRLALFGTRFTMQGGFYRKVFCPHGIDIVLPASGEQDFIHQKYVNELVNGRFLPETAQGMLGIVQALKDRHHIDGVILGGTELPLLLRDDGQIGIPLLDTTRIHVNAALNWMLTV